MRFLTRCAGLALLAALAACAAGGGAETAAVPAGGTLQAIRGGGGEAPAPLRPEPGNIWADGLTPAAPTSVAAPGR
ncbi:hypothetical protein NON00_22410 [Roseomonas sp. GC11]|uniref:hypothetical protein n=1 Tax=Roseomonas sp. GC11 TaxID=2950546 RepID=UPI0021092AA8|nr:hypothetical protein [Roseomonas sp. GC11]MCQ4162665.1 hypothetical protein [Roseomonas sp. GC11]